MQLTNRTIILTGASSGIGEQLTLRLAGRQNTVIAVGRRADRLDRLRKAGPHVVPRAADLSDSDARAELADWVSANYPAADLLINNAGIQLSVDLRRPLDLEAVRSEVDTNLIAPLHLSSLLTPLFSAQPQADIVNITSGFAYVPRADVAIYSASKAAMHSITLSQQLQLADLGVGVHEVVPPAVDSELGHQNRGDTGGGHGGLSPAGFAEMMLAGLERGENPVVVGDARHLVRQRDAAFLQLNEPRTAS